MQVIFRQNNQSTRTISDTYVSGQFIGRPVRSATRIRYLYDRRSGFRNTL